MPFGRSSVAAIISEIACLDFPDQWPGLFDVMLAMMGTGDANQVHGVMKVLAELASDITDEQVGANQARPEKAMITKNMSLNL